jgi:hypothetical protein
MDVKGETTKIMKKNHEIVFSVVKEKGNTATV